MSDTITAAIWRHMLVKGGRWTAAELAHFNQCNREKTEKLLTAMARHGFVSKYRSGQRKNGRAFGVHLDCKIPQGITVDELIAACGGNPKRLERPAEEADEPDQTMKPKAATTKPQAAPRGEFCIGRVSSVFALGAR